jgi:hypothetical protein
MRSLLALLLLIAFQADAAEPTHKHKHHKSHKHVHADAVLAKRKEPPGPCAPTASLEGKEAAAMTRAAIVPSASLVLPAGKAVYPAGQRVLLSGRVLDEQCVPVSGAVVEIWQPDGEGNWVASSRADRLSVAPHFTGATGSRRSFPAPSSPMRLSSMCVSCIRITRRFPRIFSSPMIAAMREIPIMHVFRQKTRRG